MSKKLTLQELELLNTASAYNTAQHKAICGRATMELIEYKKIEQELGVDLITLFKAIRKGAWVSYKYEKQPPKHTNNLHLNHYDEWCLSNKGYDLPLSEYGKTWALTREELL